MKFSYKIFLLTIMCFAQITNTNAQTLEEISNPSGLWYSQMPLLVNNTDLYSIYYPDFFSETKSLHFYNGNDVLNVDTDPAYGSFTYNFSFMGKNYFTASDGVTGYLFECEDENSTLLQLPAGYNWFSEHVFTQNNIAYVSLFDTNGDRHLHTFDGTNFELVPGPQDLSFSFYGGEVFGEHWLFYDAGTGAGLSIIYRFDGSSIVPIDGFPTNYQYADDPGMLNPQNGLYYLVLIKSSFEAELFEYDGTTFTKIELTVFGTEADEIKGFNPISNEIFIEYINFNQNLRYLYAYDGNSLIETSIGGYTSLIKYDHAISDGSSYIKNSSILSKVSNGVFTPVNGVGGFIHFSYLGKMDDKHYHIYRQGTDYKLMLLDESTNTVNDVNLPANHSSVNEFEIFNQNLMAMILKNNSTDKKSFWLYYDNSYVEIPTPTNQSAFKIVDRTPNQQCLYLHYEIEGEFAEGTLYKYFIEDAPVGVENVSLNKDVAIFPNPTKSTVSINIETEIEMGNLNLQIYNTTGQLVLQKKYDQLLNSFNRMIDVSSLPSGSYMINGKTDAGPFYKKLQIVR